jgi:hypothetical protein
VKAATVRNKTENICLYIGTIKLNKTLIGPTDDEVTCDTSQNHSRSMPILMGLRSPQR